ncbi:MAG: hypothetical protein ACOC2E_01110 [Bacteroidota bacterium]
MPQLHWIADLRDPWTDIFYYDKMYHLPFVRKVDLSMEKKVLHKADRITTVSYFLKDLFSKKMQGKIDQKIHVVTNGFDPEDFAMKTFSPSGNKLFTITYTGTLNADYDLNGFAKAIMKMTDENRYIEMRFVGSISPRWQKEFQLLLKNHLNIMDHVDHGQAIQYMVGADLLLLVIPRIKNNEGIVTGKIFEYIASGNPVLGIGPVEGDAAGILHDSGAGKMFDYNDHESIFQFISDCQTGKVHYKFDNEKIKYWSRPYQLQKWVGLLK